MTTTSIGGTIMHRNLLKNLNGNGNGNGNRNGQKRFKWDRTNNRNGN